MKPGDYAAKKRAQVLARRIEWQAFAYRNSHDGGPEFVAEKMMAAMEKQEMVPWHSA